MVYRFTSQSAVKRIEFEYVYQPRLAFMVVSHVIRASNGITKHFTMERHVLTDQRRGDVCMKITYNDLDDILLIEFSPEKIVRDVSYGWHIHAGFSARGLAEISILDAKKSGHWPPQNAQEFVRTLTRPE